MAVTAQTPRNVSTATAGATVFPYGFKITEDADLYVEVDGVAKTLDVDYTVSGAGTDGGGDVTFLVAMVGGETVVRARAMAYARAADYQSLGDLRSSTLNNDQDAPVLMIQQLAEGLGRSLRVRLADGATVDTELPAPDALKPLVWNAAGTALENGDTTLTGDMLLRGELASTATGKGAALVAVLQSATGAAARNVSANNALAVNVMDFVLPADDAATLAGTLDCSAAVGLAIDAAIARGRGGITFPAGRFLIGSKVTKALTGTTGFSIEGAGMGITQLIMADATGDGIEITCAAGNWWINVSPSNALRVANLSILSTVLNLGTGIKINGGSLEGRPRAPVTFDHVEFRAKDGINSQAFLTGLWLRDCGATFLTKCRFIVGGATNLTPTAVKIDATDATTDPTGFYFDHCEWFYGAVGVSVGDHVEGVYFTNCGAVGMKTAVDWRTTTSESGFHWLGGHVNTTEQNFKLGSLYDFVVQGALLYGPSTTAMEQISINVGSRFNISGNTFYSRAETTTGINVVSAPAGAAYGAFIGGNEFIGHATAINLAAAAYNVTVGRNGYHGVTTRIANANASNKYDDDGTYTPTITIVANVDAVTVYACQYARVGSTVTVSGRLDIDPTAAALTQVGVSLPIPSAITLTQQCAGVASSRTESAAILGDATNDRAQIEFVSTGTINAGWFFTFTYQVI